MEEIFKILESHYEVRQRSIPLVASENSASMFVRALLLTDFGNRYYIAKEDNHSNSWDYPRQELAGAIVEYTRELAINLFQGSHASLSALSGNQCVAGILFGLTKLGDSVIGIGPNEGGHWALSKLAERLGVRVHYVPFDYANYEIDFDQLSRLTAHVKPRFIMLDESHTLFPYPVTQIREVMGPGLPLFCDVSHTFGLIAGGALPNPLRQGATCIHGSTHKSMFGPQKGLLVFKSENNIFKDIESALHPILASNIHLDHILALAGALEELKEFGRAYAEKVVINAKHLAESLTAFGARLPFMDKGFTETHQLWLPISGRNLAEKKFEQFQECGILVNLVELPFNFGIGFRLGASEITRLGYSTGDIELVAKLTTDLLFDRSSIGSIKSKVEKLALNHIRRQFCYADEDYVQEWRKLRPLFKPPDLFPVAPEHRPGRTS